MKVSNTVVTVIVIAAVLVFAYGVGLLIRQARTGGPGPAQVDDAAAAPHAGPRVARTKDTPEERIRIKEERAKAIEKMDSATQEQINEFRSQVTKRATGRRGGRGRQNLSPQERPAQTIQASSPPEAGPPKQDANAPASQGENAGTKPSTDKSSSEPGKAGPG